MKKLCGIVFCVVTSIAAFGQSDTTQRKIAVVFGGGVGAGFTLTTPDLAFGYGKLMTNQVLYCHARADVTVLWKEQIGFRMSFGRAGRRGDSFTFTSYAKSAHSGYQYLPEYSEFTSGYNYNYFATSFVYRFGSEPFNATVFAGAGLGRLRNTSGRVELQEAGSNNFIEAVYVYDEVWNSQAELGMEFAYMRQLTQHLFMNSGVYVSSMLLLSDFTYTYSEQEYAQPVSVISNVQANDLINHLNTGVFLSLQWNRRASERAYYE